MSGIKCLIKGNKWVKAYRIERWKKRARRMMFSPHFVQQLEKNPDRIPEAVSLHMASNPFIPSNLLEQLDEVLERSQLPQKHDVSLEEVKNEMLFCLFAYGFSFNEFICYDFVQKSRSERKAYYSEKDIIALCYDVNDIDFYSLFNDKMNTYKKFRPFFGREAMGIESAQDFSLFQSFVAAHPRFVKKNVNKACGEGVELIDLNATGKTEKEIFETFLSEGKVILEEVINQSEITAAFNQSSVNTIRCVTLKNKKGISIPYTFMKIGRSGSFIDNGRAGGLLAGIDPKTGRLLKDAVDEYGFRYIQHPDSQVTFKDYQLPEWDSMREICKTMAKELPSVGMIGWDMAHTQHGWIVVEGNISPEAIGPQSTLQREIRSEMEAFKRERKG